MQWTDWHLTPRGWERGSHTDGQDTEWKDAPEDRVLTYRWSKSQSSPHSDTFSELEKEWESDKSTLVRELFEKYGKVPRHL
jgi:hypothetical protein